MRMMLPQPYSDGRLEPMMLPQPLHGSPPERKAGLTNDSATCLPACARRGMLAQMRRDKHDGYTGCGKDDHCAEPCVEKAGKCESRYDQSASEENKPGNRTQHGCGTG